MNNDLPHVAVLMAAYNGKQWIDEQLLSILQQQDVIMTVWISVDCSTDGTEEVCLQYQANYPNVHVLPYGGPFGCAARNFFYALQVVDLSFYDYVALSDQDDIWHKNKLKRAVQHLANSGYAGYSANVTAFWPNGKRLLLQKAQPQVDYDYLFEAAGPGCTYVIPASTAIPLQRQLKKIARPLLKINFHDWYIYAWVRSNKLPWFIDPEPSLEYRQHLNNQLGANTTLKSFVQRWETIGSGGWFGQAHLIAELTATRLDFAVYPKLNFSRIGLFKLGLQSYKFRRRFRDKVLFAVVCLLAAIKRQSIG